VAAHLGTGFGEISSASTVFTGTRWLHALDLTVVHTDTSVIASVIGRAAPLTAQSPHVRHSPQPIRTATRDVPALPTMNR
jgi:hypothetical protein